MAVRRLAPQAAAIFLLQTLTVLLRRNRQPAVVRWPDELPNRSANSRSVQVISTTSADTTPAISYVRKTAPLNDIVTSILLEFCQVWIGSTLPDDFLPGLQIGGPEINGAMMPAHPTAHGYGFADNKIIRRKAHLPPQSPDRVKRVHFDEPDFLATIFQRYLDLHLRMRVSPFRLDESAGDGVTRTSVKVNGN